MPVTGRKRRPGRPSAGQASVDRNELLECAERLIRRQGPSVSLEAIAAEAGVTKPIVYHHVGGKEAVIRELSFRLNERHAEAFRKAVAGVREPSDAIRAFVDAYLAVLEEDGNLHFYVTGATAPGADKNSVLAFAEPSVSGLAHRLAELRGLTGTELATSVPWAYGVIGMLHFVALWWLRDRDRTRAELAEQLTELLWKGLRGDRRDRSTGPAKARARAKRRSGRDTTPDRRR